MLASSTNFSTILGTFQYVIPFFQRSYVWKEEQLSKFADDMLYVTESVANSTSDKPFEYFMGTIISKPCTNNNNGYTQYDLIDGQQRITTFAVFFKVMSLVYEKPTLFEKWFEFSYGLIEEVKVCKLKPSEADRETMNKILAIDTNVALDKNGKPLPNGKKWNKRSMPGLLIAYNYFRDFLMDLKDKGKLIYPDNIAKGVKFINMTLHPQDDEQVYFDNINSLGVRLTTSAIIKNFVFAQDKNGYKKYQSKWEPIFEGSNNKYWNSDSGKSNLDDFLFYYLQVKTFDRETNIVNKDDKDTYSRRDTVANHIKNMCENYLKNDKNYLLEDIIDYAKIYSKIVLDKIGLKTTLGNQDTVDDMLARLGYLILKLKASTLIPYILFVVKKNSNNEKETLAILKYLETYLIRRSLTDLSSKNFNKYFREVLIAKNIITIDELKEELLDTTNDRTTNIPTDNQILDKLSELDYEGDNETPRTLLLFYELELNRINKSHVVLREPDLYTLEHLMPQELKPNWTRPDQTEDHIYKIGNMGLLTQSLQSVVKNRGWKEKLEGYAGKPGIKQSSGGLYIMQNVINQTDWNNTLIDNRTKEIVEGIINIWKA